MKKAFLFTIIALLGLHFSISRAQTPVVDSLPVLATELYSGQVDFGRNHNYSRIVEKKRLETRAKTLRIVGAASYAGLLIAGSILSVENDWNLWIYIPTAVVVDVGVMIGFIVWGSQVQSKADAIMLDSPSAIGFSMTKKF